MLLTVIRVCDMETMSKLVVFCKRVPRHDRDSEVEKCGLGKWKSEKPLENKLRSQLRSQTAVLCESTVMAWGFAYVPVRYNGRHRI